MFMLMTLLVFMFLNININNINYFYVAQCVSVIITAIIFILGRNSGLMAQTVSIFFLIFFGYYPILEYFNDIVYWDGQKFDLIELMWVNFVIFIFFALFIGGNLTASSGRLFEPKLRCVEKAKSSTVLVFLVLQFLGFYFLLYFYSFDFISLFFRGGVNRVDPNFNSQSTYLMIEFFLRPLVFNIGIYVFFIMNCKKYFSIFALAIAFCAAFPTGIPRFLAAALYIPFVLHIFFSRVVVVDDGVCRKNFIIPNILIFGIIIVFPVLDLFRWFGTANSNPGNVFGLSTMLAGHFDAYQMLARAFEVGKLSLGYGFLGAILFFIPREIWASKPIGSAQEISALSDLSLDNVSMPLIGELYLNFWYVGVFFGAVIMGLVIRYIEPNNRSKHNYVISIRWIFYFQSVGLLFFLLRGSLLSAFAYSASIALTWCFIHGCSKILSLRYY